jgi:imidazolonepropionase-like amidohydrolase
VAGTLVCLLLSQATTLSTQSSGETVAFVGAIIIDPAQEHTILDGTVVVVDGKIETVSSGRDMVPDDAAVIDVSGKFLVPGLIDAHVHIADFESARRALRSGVTTARVMGVSHFVDVGMRDLAASGAIESPEIVAAGYHVRPRPADGLFMDYPAMADLLASGVRGEQAMRRMARFMIDRNVQVIKVNATERAGLPETDPRKPFYSESELRALVSEASNAGIPVAAHAHGEVGGRAAVLAGVASIEHGTYLSDRTLDLMAERGTYLVPTIAVVADLTMPGGDYDNAVLNVRG